MAALITADRQDSDHWHHGSRLSQPVGISAARERPEPSKTAKTPLFSQTEKASLRQRIGGEKRQLGGPGSWKRRSISLRISLRTSQDQYCK
jgi:hypothetical protein